MKVLAVAYACNPFKGSEHGVGWGWVKMLAKHHEVYVIAAAWEKIDIDTWLKDNPKYRTRLFFYYPKHKFYHYNINSNFWLKIENSIFKIIMNFSYKLWLRDAYNTALNLESSINFNFCQLITYVGFRFPGRFYKLKIPFIWGPIGGFENTDPKLFAFLDLKSKIYFFLRNFINDLNSKSNKIINALKSSNILIAATLGIQKKIKTLYGLDSVVMSEIGVENFTDISSITKRKKTEPLKICWSGIHHPGKTLQILLFALSEIKHDLNFELHILGAGPMTNKWKRLSKKLEISNSCKWYGQVKRYKAIEIMKSSHLFVITSIKDLTSTVLIEALANSKPVIALDHCGFSNVIDNTCGIKIPIGPQGLIINKFSQAIIMLYEDEELRIQLAEGALNKSKVFLWEHKYKSYKNKVLNKLEI